MSNDLYQYNAEPCQSLNTEYLCETNQLIKGVQEEDCLFSMLQIKNISTGSNCQIISITMGKSLVEQVDDSHYIGIFPSREKIQTNCEKTDFTILQGTFLFIIPQGCSIKTADFTYINKKGSSSQKPLLLPNMEIRAQHSEERRQFKIHDISLDKLHQLQSEAEKLHQLSYSEETPSKHFIWTTPIYIIIVLIAVWKIVKKLQKLKKSRKPINPESQEGPGEDANREVLFIPTKTSS